MSEPPHVLVVDDDASIRDLLDLALMDAGYAVRWLRTGLRRWPRSTRWRPM
jgi:DNA-binding response OmpR family regulator